MMRVKSRTAVGMSTMMNGRSAGDGGGGRGEFGEEWEMRPWGMLVQKRNLELDRKAGLPPMLPPIRVRVKHGTTYHEIIIGSQATFGQSVVIVGELKKLLTRPTGLHYQEQKLIFKDKERDSTAFLDTVGVNVKSKVLLLKDPISQEKRYLKMQKNTKMEKASKLISEMSLEIDRLAGQVWSDYLVNAE